VLVILLYLGGRGSPRGREEDTAAPISAGLAELAPPPSTQDKPQEAVPLEAPPPEAMAAKPNFGIPVPVPGRGCTQAVMPDLNKVVPQVTSTEGTGNGPVQERLKFKQPVEEAEPSKDEFIS